MGLTKLFIQNYRGHAVYLEHCSFSCPTLNLWGFASEAAIIRAITKALTVKGGGHRES